MIIAIDFDSTITEYEPYPTPAEVRPDAIKYIRKLYEDGHTLILWTARTPENYRLCLIKLHEAGILDCFTFHYNRGYCGKAVADIYIDDHDVSCKRVNWKKFYKRITKLSKKTT